MYNDFVKDLKLGNRGEQVIVDRIMKNGIMVSRDHTNKADIRLSNGMSIEVKTDFKAYKTGNFFIETEEEGRRNCKTGLSVTEATHYVFIDVYNKTAYRVCVSNLKELINNGNYPMVRGGEGKVAIGYKVPVNHINNITVSKYLLDNDEINYIKGD